MKASPGAGHGSDLGPALMGSYTATKALITNYRKSRYYNNRPPTIDRRPVIIRLNLNQKDSRCF